MVIVQVAGIVLSLAFLALSPPAVGTMVLIPLGGSAKARMVALAVANGGRLVDSGFLSGSLVVQGEYARLAGPLREAGVLILATPAAGCGAGVSGPT